MALILTPQPPLENWFTALDRQMLRAAGYFESRPAVVNFAAVLEAGADPLAVLDGLQGRDFKIIGIEGIGPEQLAGTRWERLPALRQTSEPDELAWPAPSKPAPAVPTPPRAAGSLLIDRQVRSGQSIIFEEGDITILGAVASGAEVIAGGSVHVYGALRGRVIAGLRTGAAARIFCRKLVAELVAIDGLYYAPEHWGEGFHGRAVQIRHEAGELMLAALD